MKCISIFKCNPQIEVIDKSHCSLEDVPNFQNYQRSLEELFLDANKLTSLNDNVFKLTKLRKFSFSDNAIQDIPPDIGKLVNLVELDCSRNKIQIIPDTIKFLRGLQICDFSANNIEYLPSTLVQLKNLTCLTLNYCPIKNLPDDFGLLKNLESLELRENELESLPNSITGLESLRKLDLGRNLLTQLPEDIGKLSKLEYLLVDGNRLESVPAKIGRLENLQCLDLGQQEYGLQYLPEEIGGLTSLTDLHLSENHLQSLPDGIGNLTSLAIFKADNNYLTELNSNIGGCVSLQELVLTSNRISRLPASIGNLTELRSMNVDSNLLKELTPQIGNLKSMGILSLRDNLLTHLPSEIGHLEQARVMDFSGNRLEYLPVSITALNLKALWLSKNQAQPLPKLQIDELPNSQTRVLTCYLLPQQSEVDEPVDQLDSDGDNHERERPVVSFDTAAVVDDVELSNDVNFVRHDTPHPRELKARHQKLFNNTPKQELKGHDNASFFMADNPASFDNLGSELQPRLPLEYESNGLPEVPQMTNQQSRIPYDDVVKAIPTYTRDPADYYRDNIAGDKYRFPYENGSSKYSDLPHDLTPPAYNSGNRNKDDDSKCYILDILVRRSKNYKPGLGLSIAGGKDTPPYKDDDEGIFVSKVTIGGPAEAAGVKVGDKILAVNNNIFYDGITHLAAVDVFRKVKPDCVEFTMKVLRDPDFENVERSEDDYLHTDNDVPSNDVRVTEKQKTNSTFSRANTIPVSSDTNGSSNTINNLRSFLPGDSDKVKKASSTLPSGMSLTDSSPSKNIIYTTLVKDYKHDLGLVLENRANDYDTRSNWSNIVIAGILPDSIVSRDGKLQIDDRLLTINGTDVTGIDLDRIMLMLEGTERFIRVVVSRGENDDPLGVALRNMPARPQLGSWFSSTSNMSHRPSLLESYQRPTFGSVTSLQKQPQLQGTKPPKPPKPTHLISRENSPQSPNDYPQLDESNPIARPRVRSAGATGLLSSDPNVLPQVSDAERRAAWRQERLKSIEDDVEMAKLIAEAQRRRREES